MSSSLLRFYMTILSVILILFSLPSCAQEGQKKGKWYVMLTRMNIRESSSVHSRIVGQVHRGVQFRIINEAPDNSPLYSWYLIKTKSGVRGWFCGIYKGVAKYEPASKPGTREYGTKIRSKFALEYWEKFENETSNLVTGILSSTTKVVSTGKHDKLAFDLLFGSLLTMALFHLCLFGLHRKDISTLYFGCICILTAVLYTTSLETSLTALFPNIDLKIANKIKVICVYLDFALLVMFIRKLYRKSFPK